jgi:hypothetical protein
LVRSPKIEALFDGKQLAIVLRIKALWRLHCCSLAVYGFGEGDRAGRLPDVVGSNDHLTAIRRRERAPSTTSNPDKGIHLIKNPSAMERAKAIDFLVAEKDQPIVIPVT